MAYTKRNLLLVLFIGLCFIVHGQKTLKGTVLDLKSKNPVSFATVYINGTTKGVNTDANGDFTIRDIPIPCKLVVSHISYEVYSMNIGEAITQPLTLFLQEKSKLLNDVVIKSKKKNHRADYIQKFKDGFFGTDYWGKNASIKNDSDLIFSIDTISTKSKANFKYIKDPNKGTFDEQFSQWNIERSTGETFTVLSVTSRKPLEVDLPLLGYYVYIQLKNFTLREISNNEKIISSYAYYYFKPYNGVDYTTLEKIEKNREKLYYCSSMHFCRALFNNKLLENGYATRRTRLNDSTKQYERVYNDLPQFIQQMDSNQILIGGLKKQRFNIYYYCDKVGKPINLAEIKVNDRKMDPLYYYQYEEGVFEQLFSTATFLDNNALIRRNGTISEDGRIEFDGIMAKNGTGLQLPSDYDPTISKSNVLEK